MEKLEFLDKDHNHFPSVFSVNIYKVILNNSSEWNWDNCELRKHNCQNFPSFIILVLISGAKSVECSFLVDFLFVLAFCWILDTYLWESVKNSRIFKSRHSHVLNKIISFTKLPKPITLPLEFFTDFTFKLGKKLLGASFHKFQRIIEETFTIVTRKKGERKKIIVSWLQHFISLNT